MTSILFYIIIIIIIIYLNVTMCNAFTVKVTKALKSLTDNTNCIMLTELATLCDDVKQCAIWVTKNKNNKSDDA